VSPVLVSNGRREKWPEIRELPKNTGDLVAMGKKQESGSAGCGSDNR